MGISKLAATYAGASRTTFTTATCSSFSSSHTHCIGHGAAHVKCYTKCAWNVQRVNQSCKKWTPEHSLHLIAMSLKQLPVFGKCLILKVKPSKLRTLCSAQFPALRTKRIGRFHHASPTGRTQRLRAAVGPWVNVCFSIHFPSCADLKPNRIEQSNFPSLVQGYTIPLDKRLSADGRSLQELCWTEWIVRRRKSEMMKWIQMKCPLWICAKAHDMACLQQSYPQDVAVNDKFAAISEDLRPLSLPLSGTDVVQVESLQQAWAGMSRPDWEEGK